MGLGSGQHGVLKINPDGSAYILLEPVTADVVMQAAKARRKSPGKFLQRVINDWHEAQADKRFLARMQKRKPPTAADYARMTTQEQMKKELGL